MISKRVRVAAVLGVAGLLLLPYPAAAEESGGGAEREMERAQELARESLGKFVDALRALVESIPQYEAPEVTEEGDVVIRRKRKEKEAPPAGEAPPAETAPPSDGGPI